MENLSYYKDLIITATNCKPNEAAQVEDIMRNVIVHSTLDWLSETEFFEKANEAHELYLYMNSDEGKKYIQELKK